QPALHGRKDELADVAAQDGDFAHDGARNELVLIRGRHEQGLDLGQQVAVHAGHLEFIFEVGNSAQAADDDPPVLRAHEILQQAGKAADLDVRIVAQDFLGDFHTFLYGKERLFVLAVGDPYDHLVEQARCATHKVLVTACQRVESSRIDGSNHAVSESGV